MGSPIPGITAVGHHAIGVNMSLLAVDRPFSDRKWRNDGGRDSLGRKARRALRKSERLRFMSGFEAGIGLQTPLLDGTKLIDALGSETSWNLTDRRALSQALADKKTAAQVDLRWVGWSRHGARGGWAWSVEDRYSATVNPSLALAEFALLGPAASIYDATLLTDGTVVDVDSLTNEQFEMAEQGISNGPLPLINTLLDGGSFAVQHVRSYGAGFGLKLIQSRAIGLSFGLGARYYRGTGYYEVDVENQTAFAAFNRGFGTELVAEGATLGSALRPAGFGVALDLAVHAEIAGLWFASLAINDLGSMDWQGESYSLQSPVGDWNGWNDAEGGVLGPVEPRPCTDSALFGSYAATQGGGFANTGSTQWRFAVGRPRKIGGRTRCTIERRFASSAHRNWGGRGDPSGWLSNHGRLALATGQWNPHTPGSDLGPQRASGSARICDGRLARIFGAGTPMELGLELHENFKCGTGFVVVEIHPIHKS